MSRNEESANDKILAKIKNLLELAEDGGDDEESQTALLMAQKLMLKYKVSKNELSDSGEQKIVIRSLSVYKRIYWWEKVLVKIIAENFRVLFYIQSNRLPHQASVQRKLVFMGYPEDTDLAYEMFHLAAEAMRYYASLHIQKMKKEDESANANQLRKSYYQGFMDGLSYKFEKQREEIRLENEEYALMIRVPQDVQDKFNQEISGSLPFTQPELSRDNQAYLDGYDKGSQINLATKQLEKKQ